MSNVQARPQGDRNIIGHYNESVNDSNMPPFMDGKLGMVVSRFNYHNFDDYALRLWEVNNNLKPDGVDPYYYGYHDHEDPPDIETYDSLFDYFSRGPLELTLFDEGHRYQIFSYCEESRSRALGQVRQKAVSGFSEVDSAVDLTTIGASFDRRHYSHSREFRSHIAEMKPFWDRVVADCDFQCVTQEAGQ